METIYLSKEKKEKIEQELNQLKTVKRPEILERLAFAKSLGDLSENAEYHSSKEDQGKNEARISELEHILKNAEVVEHTNSGVVTMGSTVTVKKGDTEVSYIIVSQQEADLAEKKIADNSPLGSQLLGKGKGDTAVVTTPKGEVSYTIISVA